MATQPPIQVPLEPLPQNPPPGAPLPPASHGPLRRLKAVIHGWWSDESLGHEGGTSEQLAGARTDLAVRRTLMAADRTLMAWIRTALSLNSFGFTIYKVLQGFQQGGAALPKDATPRNAGLFLSALAALAMVMGTMEYWAELKEMRQSRVRTPFVMAVIMSVMSVALFVSIMTKIL